MNGVPRSMKMGARVATIDFSSQAAFRRDNHRIFGTATPAARGLVELEVGASTRAYNCRTVAGERFESRTWMPPRFSTD